MAQVTAFTAEKTMQLLGETFIGARLSGYNLILMRKDGSEVNVGNVRGQTGPTGPAGGATSADITAAVNAAKNATGLGMVAFNEVATEQSYAFQANTAVDITGATVTFTPIPGHRYEFSITGAMRSAKSGNTRFSMMLRDAADNSTFVRGTGMSDSSIWYTVLTGHRFHTAPPTWNTPRTYKLSAYANVPEQVFIEGDLYPSQIAVIDHGMA